MLKRRPPTQSGMILKEYRVIHETLRVVSLSSFVFREALKDVTINGYLIPKDWKVLAWLRSPHLDSEIYENPREFNPDRWIGYTPKQGSFVPFGAGTRLCPGNDLAKMETGIFLHHLICAQVQATSKAKGQFHFKNPENCMRDRNICSWFS